MYICVLLVYLHLALICSCMSPPPSGDAVKLFITAGLSEEAEGHGWEVLEWNLKGGGALWVTDVLSLTTHITCFSPALISASVEKLMGWSFALWPEFKLRKSCCFLLFCSKIASAAHLLNYFGGAFAVMTCIYFP